MSRLFELENLAKSLKEKKIVALDDFVRVAKSLIGLMEDPDVAKLLVGGDMDSRTGTPVWSILWGSSNNRGFRAPNNYFSSSLIDGANTNEEGVDRIALAAVGTGGYEVQHHINRLERGFYDRQEEGGRIFSEALATSYHETEWDVAAVNYGRRWVHPYGLRVHGIARLRPENMIRDGTHSRFIQKVFERSQVIKDLKTD